MTERQVAMVTGAGRGIGRGIALALAGNGLDIAGVDVVFDPDDVKKGLREVESRVEAVGGAFLPIQGDIASLEEHEAMVRSVLSEFGKIDVLVNNAGVAPECRRDILETDPESYDRVLSVNTRGTFFLTQHVANRMIAQTESQKGSFRSIVFISSISAEVSSPSRAEYCISKAAVSQMARLFAHRLSEYHINVYEVRPGIIATDMTAPVKEKYDRLIAEGLIPQMRWGIPEDIGKAVAALVRGEFGYATGMIVELSGGMNIRRL